MEDEPPGAQTTIDELARQAGTSVRNARMYQERGLLPPPRREGRRAFYGPGHLTRLRLVVNLAGKGYPLATVGELIEAWEQQRSLADVLGFEDALAAPFAIEVPTRVTAAELATLYPTEDPATIDRAVELGVLVPDGDSFVVPSRVLLDAGAALLADGVPIEAVLKLTSQIFEAADTLAARFVELFLDNLWVPFVDAGMPPDGWSRLTSALERQRDLGSRAVAAAVSLKLQERVNKAALASDTRPGPPG